MARDGSGNYTLPVNSWNPATNGTPATAADWQSLINDVASAVSASVAKDGQTAMTGDLSLGGNKITNLDPGTATTDAVNKNQLNTLDSTGISAYMKTLLDDADAATAQTTLGGTTVGKAVFTAADAAAAWVALQGSVCYFTATKPNGTTSLPASGFATIIFGTVHVNVGAAYDSTTGIFTAPIDGVYEFSTNVTITASSGIGIVSLTTASNVISATTPFTSTSQYVSKALSRIYQMAAGQTAFVSASHPSGTIYGFSGSGGALQSFSGRLIHPV